MHISATIGATGIIADTVTDPLLKYVYSQADQVHGLMAKRIPEPGATFAMYQSYFETAAWNDSKWKQHNEGSGIKFAHQKGATKGTSNYAFFDTREHWADAFAHELTKKSNPAAAQTLEDYVARLKQNGYMEADPAMYLKGLIAARYVLRAMPAAEFNYDPTKDYNADTGISTDKPGGGIKEWWNGLPWYGKGGIILGGGVLTLAAVKS
jgi:hypothetical protein